MDAFSKIRKSAGREEQKRQMINKAIDLLHKLANKRIEHTDARSEISRVVSEYYVLDESKDLESLDKINLEVMINNAFDVIDGVKEEKLNLYQAIMLMNKVMAHAQDTSALDDKKLVKEEEKKKALKKQEQEAVKERIAPVQEKTEEVKSQEKPLVKEVELSKADESLSLLMNKVIESKRKYHESIEELNDLLKTHGFLLSTLEPK